MWYVCMLSAQLAGALLLLLNCVRGEKKAVIKNCFPGSNIIGRDENDNCVIPKEKLQESAHKIYLNISAFADLVVGYAIAAFNPSVTLKTFYTVIGTAVLTLLFLIVEFCLSRVITRVIYSEDEIVPYDELEKNGVDTTITEKDLEKMWSECE